MPTLSTPRKSATQKKEILIREIEAHAETKQQLAAATTELAIEQSRHSRTSDELLKAKNDVLELQAQFAKTFNELVAARKTITELEADIVERNAKVERLLKYAKHKHDCAKNHDHGGCYCGNCTCGLAAELAGGKET